MKTTEYKNYTTFEFEPQFRTFSLNSPYGLSFFRLPLPHLVLVQRKDTGTLHGGFRLEPLNSHHLQDELIFPFLPNFLYQHHYICAKNPHTFFTHAFTYWNFGPKMEAKMNEFFNCKKSHDQHAFFSHWSKLTINQIMEIFKNMPSDFNLNVGVDGYTERSCNPWCAFKPKLTIREITQRPITDFTEWMVEHTKRLPSS